MLPARLPLVTLMAALVNAGTARADDAELLQAATFYASFDEAVRGDFGRGELIPRTRSNHPTEKGKFVFTDGIDATRFTIAKTKGIHGGALEAVDVLPNNGRIFVPVRGNLAFQKEGWGGAVSVWCNGNPNELLKTSFCDPIQITHKGSGNGGIWFDFNDAKPRDFRHGAFPAVPEGQKGIGEDDPQAPLVKVPKIGWKTGEWHHVVLTWSNFDTGRPDARSALYIDGQLIGQIKDRPLAMAWDLDQAGVYFAVNYIGLLDEMGLFNRELTPAEVARLHKHPGLLAPLKK